MINVCLVPVFGGGKIDYGDVSIIDFEMFGCSRVELSLPYGIDSNVKLEFAAFVSTNEL